MGWVLALVLLATAGTWGCNDEKRVNRDKPGGPLYRMWDSNGERIIVTDAKDEVVCKFRKRSRGIKVYDSDLAPVGVVGSGPTQEGESSPEERQVRVEHLGKEPTEVLEHRGENIWEMERTFRLERTSDGWAVFDENAEWIGRFHRGDDGGWRLEKGRNEPKVSSVEKRDRGMRSKSGRKTVFETRSNEMEAPVLLALSLDELSLVHRVAIGRWLGNIEGNLKNPNR